MKHLDKPLRFAGVFLLLGIGLWAVLAPVSPGAESAAHQDALHASVYSNGQEMPSFAGGGAAEGVAEPATVILSDVEFSPVESMYERWQKGEIDIDEKEYRVSEAERLALQEAARNIKAPLSDEVDVTIKDEVANNVPEQGAPTLSLVSSFDALDVSDCCGGGTSVPPDSDMAAGPSHLIAVENSSFEIYNKSGTSLASPTLFDNFLNSAFGRVSGDPGFVEDTFDPTVLYDEEEDRFVMGIEDGEFFFLMVTATSDPTGAWNVYEFDAQFYGDEFFDYPHIGIGDHAIFMGANMFNGSIPGLYEGRIYAMDKTAAYAGSPMAFRSASTGGNGGTPQPLNLTGFSQGTVPQPFDTHYFITDRYDGQTADLWAWPDALGVGTPSVVQTYTLTAGGMPLDMGQLGTTDKLQANDFRFRGFEYRNGYGWTTDTVSWTPDATTVNGIRFISIDLSASPYTLTDQEQFGYNTSHSAFPDLAVDHCGNVVVGSAHAGASMYAGAEYDGFVATGSGTVNADTWGVVKAGEATYYSFDGAPYRWGDYSGMAIDPDGKTFWYMGEYAKTISGYAANYGNYIAELTYGCVVNTPPADFDGDGDTDLSLFRPSNGGWYVKNQFAFGYGTTGDIPVPGDYDGDGNWDVALFRPSNSGWYIKDQFVTGYGTSGDIPVPGDYDGDGTTDIAVFRPSNGGWYVKDQFVTGYGKSGDIPIPGDYDGDGTTDIAVFRPSNGGWYVKNQFAFGYGTSGDIPIPGDYDGDGAWDVALFRPSNSGWYVRNQFVTGYGTSGDIPIPGDYDGDGDWDVAVFRSSNGGWYVKDQFVTGYGKNGDFPLPVRDTNVDGDPYQ